MKRTNQQLDRLVETVRTGRVTKMSQTPQCPIRLRRDKQDVRCSYPVAFGDNRCRRHGGIDRRKELITHRPISRATGQP